MQQSTQFNPYLEIKLEEIDRQIRRDPKNHRLYRRKGILHIARGELEIARKMIQKAAWLRSEELNLTSWQFNQLLGDMYYICHFEDEAREEWRRAREKLREAEKAKSETPSV